MNNVDWDRRFFDLANYISKWSKDRSTQVGAVIVDKNKVVLSMGYNGFCRGIDDNIEKYHNRPEKYKWTEHAERNAIYNAARQGSSLIGCTIYTSLYPCMDCARGIVQSGIVKVVSSYPDFDHPTWGGDFKCSRSLFIQSDVKTFFI